MFSIQQGKSWLFLLFAICANSIFFPSNTLGQSKVEIDEEVKVFFLNKWYDGIVIDTKKKQALVEFEFVGPKREVFDRKNLRRQYEYDAVDFGRTWESTSGTKIDAALKDLDGEDVKLIKLDLRELTVPLSKLSTRDQSYVRKMKKSFDSAVAAGRTPARTPDLPELEDFGGTFGAMSMFNKNSSDSIKPLGKIPSYLTDFKQAGAGFNMTRKDQDLVSVIPVGGPDQLVLMTARENNWISGRAQFQSQVYWVSLRQKKVVGTVHITPEDYAIDYDPRNKLMLTFNQKDTFDDEDDPDHYTIWKMQPGAKTAEPVVRWKVDTEVFEKRKAFGKIISDRIVLTKTARHTYAAWDIVEKKNVYWLKTQSFFDVPIIVSPDRNHLIFPEDGQVSVFDAHTGEMTFSANVPDRHCSGANINAAGDKLAVITERNIYVWNLSSGSKEPTVYPAPLMASPFSARIEWIGDDHILGESFSERILYRLSLKLPVWSYRMDVSNYFLNKDPRKNMVIDGKFFYVAEPSGPFSNAIAVGAVELPGPGVEEVTKDIDPESLLILKPGVAVGLQMTGVTDEGKVEQWIDAKIKENQWVRDDNAEIQIFAEMGIGKLQTVQYGEMGGSIRGGETTSASFRPHFSKLLIKKGTAILWQTGTSTGAPPVVRGSNIQGRVNSMQKPNLNFFKSVKMDPKIIDPKYSRGFGVSKLGLRGIQVVSTTPPGREDDPMAAAAKAEEDEKKADEARKKNQEDNQPGESGGVQGGFGRG